MVDLLADYSFLVEGAFIFHLKMDGEYGGRYFEKVVVKRVEEIMVVWENYDEDFDRYLEFKDFKERFFPQTSRFLKIVKQVNYKMEEVDLLISDILWLVDKAEKMARDKIINTEFPPWKKLNK